MLQTQTDGTSNHFSDLEHQLRSEATSISPEMTGLEFTTRMIKKVGNISASQPDNVRLECLKYSNCKPSAKSRKNNISVNTPFYVRTPFGSIYFQVQTEHRHATMVQTKDRDATDDALPTPLPQQQTVSLIWHPASWATRWGLAFGVQISVLRSHMGWKYVFSPIRSVRDDSLVFSFCRDGNVSAVRELLLRGDASLSDTDSYGRQPLNVSIMT